MFSMKENGFTLHIPLQTFIYIVYKWYLCIFALLYYWDNDWKNKSSRYYPNSFTSAASNEDIFAEVILEVISHIIKPATVGSLVLKQR